jgi:hypothetical protein
MIVAADPPPPAVPALSKPASQMQKQQLHRGGVPPSWTVTRAPLSPSGVQWCRVSS